MDELLREAGTNWQPAPTTSEEEHPAPQSGTETSTCQAANTQASEEQFDSTNERSGSISLTCFPPGETRQSDPVSYSHSGPTPAREDMQSDRVNNTAQHSRPVESIDSPQDRLLGLLPKNTKDERTSSDTVPSMPKEKHHSRPKKQCSRRLRHPSRRLRRERLHTSQPLEEAAKEPQQEQELKTSLPGSSGNGENRDTATSAKGPKPVSRPKRRCRFGPRARQARSLRLHRTQPWTPPLSNHKGLLPETPDGSQGSQTASPSQQHSQPLAGQTTPCRVTPQPAFSNIRTPIDAYINKGIHHRTEVNSSAFAARRLGISEQAFDDAPTKEINDLLEEIERTRREALEEIIHDQAEGGLTQHETEVQDKTTHSLTEATKHELTELTAQLDKGNARRDSRHTSSGLIGRRKEKCHFGPGKVRGRGKLRSSPSPRHDSPPPPPLSRTPVLPGRDGSCQTPLGDMTAWGLRGYRIRQVYSQDWISQEQYHLEEEEVGTILPDRPTFFHYSTARRAPFGRYDKSVVDHRTPPLFQKVHERLGITEEEFDTNLRREIDELLTPPAQKASSSSPARPSEPLTVMTKADVLRFLGNRALTSGSELGIYKWAADLGWARYRYDFNLEYNEASWLAGFDLRGSVQACWASQRVFLLHPVRSLRCKGEGFTPHSWLALASLMSGTHAWVASGWGFEVPVHLLGC